MLPRNIPNPFRASVVADPWKEAEADVPNIHGAEFQACCDAVEYVRSSGSSAGLLIHGQAGSGKTHLLARLRQRLADGGPRADVGDPRQIFVSVRLATSPRRIWRHVRRHFLDDLLRPIPDHLTQLEQILAARLSESRESEGDLAAWWEYMREECAADLDSLLYDLAVSAQADDALVRVLGHFVRGTHRREARSWLRGEPLTEEALQKLGLPVVDEGSDDPEETARDVVLSLCRLAGPRIPVVFCFDQIEALDLSADASAGLAVFAGLIAELFDGGNNTVLISCIQTDYAPNLRQAVPQFAYGRITSYANRALAPLRLNEAVELVSARLTSSRELAPLRKEHADPLWPLTTADVSEVVGESGCTPRELLSFCAQRFAELQSDLGVPPVSEKGFLNGDWQRRVEAALSANEAAQTEEIISNGLELLIQCAQPDWTVSRETASRDLELVLTGPQGEGRVGISLCTQVDMKSLAGRLRRLNAELPNAGVEKLVLIRDARTPISQGARKARDYLDALEKKDAVLCRPSAETLAALDALRSLLADASSGDLSSAGRTIRIETVREWLVQNLAEPLREFADQLVAPPRPDDFSGETEIDQLITALQSRHVAAVDDLARELDCDADRLDASVREHPERVGYLAGPPLVVFEHVAEGVGEK